MTTHTLHHGDCLEVLRTMPDCSVDACVTDPPYGLSFMGKAWDYDVPGVDVWREVLRVLKPGGHLLAFAGTRTQHRMAVAIEDAGFEIRDMIAWVYGSGFPKSLDVSKAIDGHITSGRSDSLSLRQVNETRPGEATVRPSSTNGHRGIVGSSNAGPSVKRDVPATPEAQQWAGWGTALKPAMEMITMARKPLDGTVAANVLQWGTGGLNVDGCRVGTENMSAQFDREWKQDGTFGNGKRASQGKQCPPGRWPANLIHDGSEEVVGLFPQTTSGANPTRRGGMGYHGAEGQEQCHAPRGQDTGNAARFFYTAKATRAERQGCTHPTVKPLDLMAYLCRLVTPPGGIVLDPFMGSGTTIKAALSEGFQAIGIEREPAYFEMAQHRMNGAQLGLPLEATP